MEKADIDYLELQVVGLEFIKLVRSYYGGKTADALAESIGTVMPDYSNDLLLRALSNTNQGFVTVKIPFPGIRGTPTDPAGVVHFIKTIRSYLGLGIEDAKDIYVQAHTRPMKIPVDDPRLAVQLQRDLKDLGCEIYE